MALRMVSSATPGSQTSYSGSTWLLLQLGIAGVGITWRLHDGSNANESGAQLQD